MSKKLIRISNLSFAFNNNERSILNDVSFEVGTGKTLVILGESGGGKSVLLKIIIGILKGFTGTIIVNGCDTKQVAAYKNGCSMVLQGCALFDGLSVADNVMFSQKMKNEKEKLESAAYYLEQVGCTTEILKTKIHQLSEGNKKRVAIARAISCKPSSILLDEPTSGLDPISADIVNGTINKYLKSNKVTSLIVTHDLYSALTIADSIAILQNGKIDVIGSAKDFRNSENTTVKQYIKHGIACLG